MKRYNHLTREQRYTISVCLRKKMSLSGIASCLCLALKKVDTTVNKNEDRKEKEVQAGFHA